MNDKIEIPNNLPESVTFQGVHYQETKDLSMTQLVLFLERDLHQLRKKFSEFRPEFALSLIKQQGSHQIRVGITAKDSAIADSLFREIENILWSYNRQVMFARNGSLYPSTPRFTYRFDFSTTDTSLIGSVALAGG